MHESDAPACHACGAQPAYQWQRLATDAEARPMLAEIHRMQVRVLSEEDIARRYGPMRVAVGGCASHHLGDEDDGDSGSGQRALLHDADCGGHGVCGCDGGAVEVQ